MTVRSGDPVSRTPSGEGEPDSVTGGAQPATPVRRGVHVWWIALLTGAVGALAVLLFMPHGRAIEAAWELPVKLLVFACLACGIALFPWPSRVPHWVLYAPFVFFAGYLFPRISGFYFLDGERADADSFYTHLYLLLYPGLVLTTAAAYRLGGGTPGRCLKVVFTGIAVIFSGFLDLMWFVVNPVDIPPEIDAPHITLLTGGPISFGATVVFALAHLPLVVAFNLLPLDRWIGRLLGTGRPRA
ncbi:hypothetical protein [Actinomadura sp. 6K520]|jgi:hypothetical protein|uniref:hypothetical protein n=1 Tax=Actinomadura sp. 6K520 TaxID=2530364 RepID=UPI001FB764EE|nr:hypothetical protein [Actinomadura sp. 6K520]